MPHKTSPRPGLRRWLGTVLFIAGAAGASLALGGEASPGAPGRYPVVLPLGAASATAEGRVMVRFRPGATVLPRAARTTAQGLLADGPQAASVLAARHAMALADGRMLDTRTQVITARGVDSATLRARLQADPEIEAVWLDGRRHALATLPNDPLFPAIAGPDDTRVLAGQWYLRAPSAETPSSIDALAAWKITWGLPDLVVADIDTGIRYEHPDLKGKTVPGRDLIADTFVANDGNGRDADATDVGDWLTAADVTNSACPDGTTPSDSSWHGTQTAGVIAAATDNGVGMAGTGRDVKVLPVRVLGRCGGFDSDIIAGMRWAAGLHVPGVPDNIDHPSRVLNMSLGGPDATAKGTGCADYGYDAAITELLSHEVVIVVSAGNESVGVSLPAACSGVIGVAAIRTAGDKVGFSNLGPEVAISAPGGNCVLTGDGDPCLYPILTTSNTGLTTAVASTYTNSFGALSLGTSFSAPQVSGTAALMLSVNPSLTAADVRSMLQSTARPFPTTGGTAGILMCTTDTSAMQDECYCTTQTCGAGMLDAGAAVAAAAGMSGGVSVDVQPSTKSPVIGTSVTLDGSSAAPGAGASIASYAWTIVSGTGATFTGATDGPTAKLATSGLGPVTVKLTVTDTAGGVGVSFRTLQVVTQAPIADITGPMSVAPGGSGSFDGSGSTATGSHTLTGYQWSLAAGNTAATLQGSTTGATVTLQGVSAGTVTLTLTVTDDAGLTGSTSRTVTIAAPAGSGGGGGGGAFGLPAGLGLLAAALALGRRRSTARRG